MKNKKIQNGLFLNKKMKYLMDNSNFTDEDLTDFVKGIKENLKLALSKTFRFINYMIIATMLWFLVKITAIQELSVIGIYIKIEELSILLFILPPIIAFFFYQFMIYTAYFELGSILLIEYNSRKHQPIVQNKLIGFLALPDFISIESLFSYIDDRENTITKINSIWIRYLGVLMLFIPIMLLSVMSYHMFKSPFLGYGFSLVSILIVSILVVKGFFLLYITREERLRQWCEDE